MPIRSYDQLDMLDIVLSGPLQGYDVGTYLGTVDGTIDGFGNVSISCTVTPPEWAPNNWDGFFGDTVHELAGSQALGSVSGLVDFEKFPTIPENSLITKIRWVCQVASGGSATLILGTTSGIDDPDIQAGAAATVSIGPSGGTVFSDANNGLGMASGGYTGPFSYEEDLSSAPISVDDLKLLYRSQGFGCSCAVSLYTPSGFPRNNHTFSGTASAFAAISAWRMDVTWDYERYSWYIKPTEEILGSKPVEILEPENIIQVAPDEEPPEGYEYFGSSEDFPVMPFVWWEFPDSDIYIYSPISPGDDWEILPEEPVCIGCTTVTLGALTIRVANASGIYVLDPDKTNDTVYTRTDFSTFVSADDVKIPEPMGRTSLIP